ncbi:DUF58 domain-containing protein [Deinococcus knuensis]|uniref:DUF58 domain-containing protein n=1 Tax=Deinococcus knuensis TaxID=1837380 RepID=A0ABQ2SE65_9DEIO|nr:DUF58 domain-containing protein [Deinococcus knuensis]GGS24635.1 hypothetical protein GCM10008961_15310 [Deinococcus knuensis]
MNALPWTTLLGVWSAVIGALLLTLWLISRRPPQVTLTRQTTPRTFEGSAHPLTLTFRVRSRWPLRVVMDDPTPRSVVPARHSTLALHVLNETTRTLDTTLTFNRRGQHVWPGGILRWADPLGLFWHAAPLANPATHTDVFPGTHRLILPDLLRPLLSEGTLTRRVGLDDPISLRGTRDYVSGDPPGRIQWRLTARTGTLTVREPERTAASSLTVFVDTGSGGEVFVDSAARLAASLVREAATLGLPVAAATSRTVTPAGRDAASLHAALLTLARLAPHAPGEPLRLPPTRSGGNLIILTASPGPDLLTQALHARATAARVSIVTLPEGYYLEPGEQPRRQWSGLPDAARDLERRAAALAGAGIQVVILRGNQSVLTLAH